MFKILLLVPLLFISIHAEESVVDKIKGRSGMESFFIDYDWDNMWKEITIEVKLTICKVENLDDGLFSPYISTISEPMYLAGVSIKKGEVKAFNMNLVESLNETGTNKDDGGVYVSIIKFPIMDQILGNTTGGALVFDKGSIMPIYLGLFDPKKWDNILAADLTPEKAIFSSISAQLASVVSCVAYASLDLLPFAYRRSSATGRYLKDTSDVFYYSTGCIGPTPTGTSTVHQDPISNAILTINSVLYDMFLRKGVVANPFVKHLTRNILNNHSNKILCSGIYNPIMPQSMYSLQLLAPTVSKTHEFGVSPAQYNFHGAGESSKGVFFIINQRRDYAAFAYKD